MNIINKGTDKKIITLFIILIVIASIFSYNLIVNTIQYTKILETEANFDLKITEFDVDDNIVEVEDGEWEGKVWFNTSVKVWNNGSTPITVNQIWFDIYLNEVNPKSYVSSKGSKLYMVQGVIQLKPGESVTYDLEPATANISDHYYIQNNLNKNNPSWNWIVVGGKAKMIFPEFSEEDWEYESSINFGSAFFMRRLEVEG
ncbi:MAG: hypothetical protein ACQESD_01865 [Thermoplasmatota archaeon]